VTTAVTSMARKQALLISCSVSILSDPQCKGCCNDLSTTANCKLPLRTVPAQPAFPELIERPLMRMMQAQGAFPEVIERPLMRTLQAQGAFPEVIERLLMRATQAQGAFPELTERPLMRMMQAQRAFPEVIERPLMRTMQAQGAFPGVIERPKMWILPSGVSLSQAYIGIQDGCHQVILVFFLQHDGLWLL